jgi:hypothetical protein
MEISILVATRGRPKLLRQMWKKCLSLADNPQNVEYILYIDDDDNETIEMYHKMKKHDKYGGQIRAIIGKQKEMIGSCHCDCYKISDSDIIGIMADDCEFMTEGWDNMVIDAFSKVEDKILLVYGSSGHRESKMAVTWFIHRNWVDTVGYPNPPFFKCAEGDRWVTYLAKKVKRLCYLPDLKIIHRYKETEGDPTSLIRKAYRKKMLKWYMRLEDRRKDDARKLKLYIKRFIEDE